MKSKSIIFTAILGIMLTACSEKQTNIKTIEEKENFHHQLVENNELSIVIVRFEYGHKLPGTPPRECSNDSERTCWRWFPIDQAQSMQTNDIIAMAEYNEADGQFNLTIPITEDRTDDFLTTLTNEGVWHISNPIYIDDPTDMYLLGESRTFYFSDGDYEITSDNEYIYI